MSERQTGRTTRMIEKAKLLAKEGKKIYIVAANFREQKRIENLIDCEHRINIRIITPSMGGCGFNWETMRCPWLRPDAVVLVDHYAAEIERNKILDRLARFDLAMEKMGTEVDKLESEYEIRRLSPQDGDILACYIPEHLFANEQYRQNLQNTLFAAADRLGKNMTIAILPDNPRLEFVNKERQSDKSQPYLKEGAKL